MEFEKVVSGIIKYVNRVIIPTMNDWQKIGARLLLSRLTRSSSDIKRTLSSNAYIMAFGVMNNDGSVDIENLIKDIRGLFEETPVIEVNVPLYGSLKFNESDIDTIYKYIMEG